MSKKDKNKPLNMEKLMANLKADIEKQSFESQEELEDFLQSKQRTIIDDIPEPDDNKSKAQDLVFEAFETSIEEGKKLVKKALKLNPDNVDAHILLGDYSENLDEALVFYEKAVELGEKDLGEDVFSNDKGYFWGLIETRPFMRAKEALARCFKFSGRIDEAIEIFEEMLQLNPNDNQGVRYELTTLLLMKDDFFKYKKYYKKYEKDIYAGWHYNYAIYGYKLKGSNSRTKRLLFKAYKLNKYVPEFLLGFKEIPDEIPGYFKYGDSNEAIEYFINSIKLWQNTKGALDWLYDFYSKNN